MNEANSELLRKIDAGIKAAIAEAIEEHRRMGRSIVVWKDGQVATIPPSKIQPQRKDPEDRAA
jgi:hypothetical protein